MQLDVELIDSSSIVIPEFPTLIGLPIILALTLFSIIFYKRKLEKKIENKN
ncbi:hypothetical protein MUO66_02430 [Candidatus Bathyarchaeota archaeon]|nr:hypothetical protein [Candidatus Bathyarchaeota archaeon]